MFASTSATSSRSHNKNLFLFQSASRSSTALRRRAINSSSRLSSKSSRLPFTSCRFDLRFKVDRQFTGAGLIKGLSPTECLIEDPHLVLREVGSTGHGAKLTVVVRTAWRSNAICDVGCNGDGHRWN